MHLATHDYLRDRPNLTYGLVSTARLITAARAETPNTMLLDNGDFLQGSPLGDYVLMHGVHPNPMIDAMNRLGYDAANIGNHEFSCGMDYLRKALVSARFPCISANALDRGSAQPLFSPTALIRKTLTAHDGSCHTIQIGLIGVLPPQTASWDLHVLGGALHTTDMIAAVQQNIPQLRAKGADIVIVLAHCGIGRRQPEQLAENTALAIARLPGVDAIIMGHQHLVFPGTAEMDDPLVDARNGRLNGIPAVMPGFFGSHLGQIDLELARTKAGWRVLKNNACVLASAGHRLPPDKTSVESRAVFASMLPAHKATRRWADRPIARTERVLHSYFSLVSDCPAIQLVSAAQKDFVTNRLSNTRWASLPILSAAAPFRAGGRGGPANYSYVPVGPFRIRHATDLYIHPNRIMAFLVTGRDIRNWLENSALIFRQIIAGQHDQPLLDTTIPSFHFDAIHGLTYTIHLNAPPAGKARVDEISHAGMPVQPDQEFILVTNSYRGGGSGGFADGILDRIVLSEPRMTRDILIDFLRGKTFAHPPAPPCWSFAPMPGTSVTFETAPAALEHLDDVSHLAIEPLGETEAGFMRFRIWL